MIALQLNNIKDFMNKLLCSDIFDNFLLQEAVITKAASFVIDGHIQKEFYSSTELSELGLDSYSILPFKLLRTNCFDLIKGKQTPGSFKFVFLLSPENVESTLSSLKSTFTPNDIKGLFINILFHDQTLTLTTGISYSTFSLDKSLDVEWDILVRKFLSNNDICFEEL